MTTDQKRPTNPAFAQYFEVARLERLDAFLEPISDETVREAARAAVLAGDAIKRLDPEFKVKEGEGHRSGVTKGDELAQEIMLGHLAAQFPDAKFLSEEGKGEHPNLLDIKNPIGLFEAPLAFIMDPTDGTATYGNKLGTWCVGVGVMYYGSLVGSAVFAPAINGGMLTVAEKDSSVRVGEWEFEKFGVIPRLTESRQVKDCFVSMGVDPTLYPSLMHIVPEIGANIRTWGLANSGILGLVQVACNRIQAVVNTPQKAWDWAPAYRALVESGHVFRFFRLVPDQNSMVGGKARTDLLEEVYNGYDFEAFCALPKQNRLGFVAGEPDIVNRIFNLLPTTGWARTNPDTASGTWK